MLLHASRRAPYLFYSPSMAEDAAASGMKGETEKPAEADAAAYPSFSLKIWPPTQRTRDAVVHRLIKKLASHSVLSHTVLSQRYGVLPEEEAASAALAIEEEAFSTASAALAIEEEAFSTASDSGGDEDDGIEVLYIYSREISRRVMELAKARAAAAPQSCPRMLAFS